MKFDTCKGKTVESIETVREEDEEKCRVMTVIICFTDGTELQINISSDIRIEKSFLVKDKRVDFVQKVYKAG